MALGLSLGTVSLGTVASAEVQPEPRAGLVTVPSSMSVRAPGFDTVSREAPGASVRPTLRPREREMPDLRWDHVDGSERWTRAAMRALDTQGQRLVDTVPRDIGEWCPAYADGDDWERKAFWAGLLSTLAKHESTWRPKAVGGGGLWYGLVQILPATARGYGCRADSGEALKDGASNMACAVRIMNRTVPRDGVVSRGMRGVAADWGPFHSERKREDMRTWMLAQPYCSGLQTSMRPPMRPGGETGDGELIPLFVAWELDKAFLAAGGPVWPDGGPDRASDGAPDGAVDG